MAAVPALPSHRSQTAGASLRTLTSHPITTLMTTHATQAPVEQIANKVKNIPKRPLGYMGGVIPTQKEKVMINSHETWYVSRYLKAKGQT